MRIFIRPEYHCLSDFIKKIPQHFDHEGEVLYARRNVIRKMRVGEIELNVKRYGVPSFFNRLIYTFSGNQRAGVPIPTLTGCWRLALKLLIPWLILRNGEAACCTIRIL